MGDLNWQTFLWQIVNDNAKWWPWVWGSMALVAAVLMFLRTVLRMHWNLLAFFQGLYCFGLFMIFLIGLNSGWTRWIEPIFAVSGMGMAVIYFFDLHRQRRILRYAWLRIKLSFQSRIHVDNHRDHARSTFR